MAGFTEACLGCFLLVFHWRRSKWHGHHRSREPSQLTFYFMSVCKFSQQGQGLKMNPKGKHSTLLPRTALFQDRLHLPWLFQPRTYYTGNWEARLMCTAQADQQNKTSLNSPLSIIPADTSTMAQCPRTKHLARHLTGFSSHTLRRYTLPWRPWDAPLWFCPPFVDFRGLALLMIHSISGWKFWETVSLVSWVSLGLGQGVWKPCSTVPATHEGQGTWWR